MNGVSKEHAVCAVCGRLILPSYYNKGKWYHHGMYVIKDNHEARPKQEKTCKSAKTA